MLNPFKEPSKFEVFKNKKTDKIYITKSFLERDSGEPARYVSKVIDSEETHTFFKEIGEVVLHISEGERLEIKAIVYEDSKEIKAFTIQKFVKNTGKPYGSEKPVSFTFSASEIKTFDEFIHFIPHLDLSFW